MYRTIYAFFPLFVLFSLNLTAQQATLLLDAEPGLLNGILDDRTAQIGDQVFFYATNGTYGKELWVTDGTPAGTQLVRDLAPGQPYGATGSPLIVFKNKVWFKAREDGSGYEIWSSDGTAAGTQPINVAAGSYDANPEFLAAGDDYLYFVATDENYTHQLWRTDGTQAGTVSLGSDFDATWAQLINGIAVMGDVAFFTFGGPAGSELWRTDGTPAGTYLVKNISSSFGGISDLTVIGDKLYFAGDDNFGSNYEPWVSDGTEAGTVQLANINPIANSFPKWFTEFKGKVYFATINGLWRTDGTPAGTEQFSSMSVALPAETVYNFASDDNYFYFSAESANEGRELWRTDGTVAGTQLVRNIAAGQASASPREMLLVDGTLYFAARFDNFGEELGRSDGTAAGTTMLADVYPGFFSSSPGNLHLLADRLVFIAEHPDYGQELFFYDLTSGTGEPASAGLTLRAAPNPATDRVFVRIAEASLPLRVRVFNPQGAIAWQQVTDADAFEVNLAGLPAGVYRVEIIDSRGVRGQQAVMVSH